MVKRCAYGLCRSDTRYPERVEGITFHPFPKPKSDFEKCLRWIKACNRPHAQLNVEAISKNTYVCSKHFSDGKGPSDIYPDPIPQSSTTPKPHRPPPKRRKLLVEYTASNPESSTVHLQGTTAESEETSVTSSNDTSISTQTEEKWVDAMDVLVLAAENQKVSDENRKLKCDLQTLSGAYNEIYQQSQRKKRDSEVQVNIPCNFDVGVIGQNVKQFKYYTAFAPDQFEGLFRFLVPTDLEETTPIQFPSNRVKEVMRLSLKNQLFLTIIKLRHDFHYADLAFRFNISKQTTSVIFTHWINFMFLRFGELSIWPHRDVISVNMPQKFKEEFSTTFGILDCTEIKINKPSSLKAQSQTYSDYKSCNTLKGLVACDPRGSITYASMLFSGGISDKDIFVQSNFQDMLCDLVDEGYLKQGDALMADKGFNIETEVGKCGLRLNIPPFASQGKQMSRSDAIFTKKIAKHRVHVERAIERSKRFKILSGKVKLSLFTLINQIWYVCAMLTNFFPPCIQDNN